MQINAPILFIEINDTNYIFVVGEYDDNHNLKITANITTPCVGIDKNKLTNIGDAIKTITNSVELIEKKLNFIFKEATIILDNFDYSCINISGFKKLNGSQVLKENISYILNSLKLAIIENEEQKTILHIFNSKSVLDGTSIENLPIGLFGDFYSHELTFFLIRNNDLKNINQIFNRSNLSIKKLFLKSFSEGTQLINQKRIEDFIQIKINKNNSRINIFNQASFRYSEDFNFGTSIIYKDIQKICSLDNEIIKKILLNNYFNKKSSDNSDFIDKKYFISGNYRKIRKKLIQDIVNARIEEIIDIIIYKNPNITSFGKNDLKIYIIIQDELISNNFKEIFQSYFIKKGNSNFSLIKEIETNDIITNTAKLLAYGWKKEAIPITQTKTSLITRIFKSIFS
jgi:cell division protein FtsA